MAAATPSARAARSRAGRPATAPSAAPAGSGTGVPVLLRAVAVALFVAPADQVLEPLGASGYLALVLGLVLAASWAASAVLGLHDPVLRRHPGRIGLGVFVLAGAISYIAYTTGTTIRVTTTGQAAADRWLLLLATSSAIALVTTQTVRSVDQALVLVRALVGGATFCGVVALIQFVFHVDPVESIRALMIGFVDNGGSTTFQDRGGLMRVAGTTFHPIELAVVSAMVLPLAIWRLLYDPKGRRLMHAAACAVLLIAIAGTVSRSGILALVLGLLLSVGFLPRIARRWALVLSPVAVAGFFVTTPGLIGTLTGSITAGTSDSSITNRLDNYPRVAELVLKHPWFGTGPSTYLPESATRILDNQYLGSAVTLGLVGLVATVCYFGVPAVFSLVAAQFARDERLRALTGCVAAGCGIALVASATFDSLGFPVFSLLFPFFLGLAGSCWLLVRAEQAAQRRADLTPTPAAPVAEIDPERRF